MRQYTICHTAGVPDWEKVPALDIDTALWREKPDIEARAKLCWSDDALHVLLWAREAHIRAEHLGPLGMPCEDSCLEFFFSPLWGDSRYFNIEYNPNACLYLGFGDGENPVRLLPERDWFKARSQRTQDGWQVEYAVPFEFVRLFFPGFAPKAGDRIRANCYKCGDLTPKEHYLAWNPCTSEVPNFHRPRDFGEMTFGGGQA